MTNPPPRRSSRDTHGNYTSFGRDNLAEALGCSRAWLDSWLLSSKVHPHLVLWHSTCIERTRRFNEGVEWINTGYFFEACNLEDDVLLLCLEEGPEGSEADANGVKCKSYADQTARTFKWTSVELWARSTWRIVQDNCGKGDIFEKAVKFHPAAAYGIVCDLLCVAFHNIAYVGPESVWANIINNARIPELPLTPPTGSTSFEASSIVARQIAMDLDPDTLSLSDDGTVREEKMPDDDEVSNEASDEASDDSDFVMETPRKNRGRAGRMATPTAPVKASRGKKRMRTPDNNEDTPSKKIHRWMTTLASDENLKEEADNMLKIFEESGAAITGYRSAATLKVSAVQRDEQQAVDEEDIIVLRRDSSVWS